MNNELSGRNREAYLRLRRELSHASGAEGALIDLVHAEPDGAAGWVEQARAELREALARGRLVEATRIGDLIAAVFRVWEGEGKPLRSGSTRFIAGLGQLSEAIQRVLDCDYAAASTGLAALVYDDEVDPTLRWAAALWRSRPAAECGELDEALRLAARALETAEALGQQARALTMAHLAELQTLAGQHDLARSSLKHAQQCRELAEEPRALSLLLLSRARLEAAAGQQVAAADFAAMARQADPQAPEPVLFLAEQALIAEDLDEAEWVLGLFPHVEPMPLEIARAQHLVELARRDEVPEQAISAYCRLRGGPLGAERLAEIETLARRAPYFVELRELLAWTRLKRGDVQQAAQEFEALSGHDNLPPHVLTSVRLGLACLANLNNRERQTGIRLQAIASVTTLPARLGILAPARERSDTPAGVPAGGALAGDAADEFEAAGSLPLDTTFVGPLARRLERVLRGGAAAAVRPAAFTGTLDALGLPELLDFLRVSRRTGTLVISASQGVGAIHLRAGMITGAVSPGSASLGHRLVQRELIAPRQLATARRLQRRECPNELLGVILVRQGVVEAEAVRAVLEEQALATLVELIGWTSGCFAFDPDPQALTPRPAVPSDLALDTQGLLLDALRLVDEAAR
ncbi:MAG: DUF4388 domain-containing protein [Proteobacteria bacterium]|nr:DUF4388 domain-containing protein [Pseudomonadota bacterium]